MDRVQPSGRVVIAGCPIGLDNRTAAGHQADDEEHEEDKEQDLRDTGRSSRDAAEAQYRSDNRDQQKYPCIPQHC